MDFVFFLIEVNLFINKNTYIVRLWDALYALLTLFSGEVYTMCFGHFELVTGQTAMIIVRWPGLSGTCSMLFSWLMSRYVHYYMYKYMYQHESFIAKQVILTPHEPRNLSPEDVLRKLFLLLRCHLKEVRIVTLPNYLYKVSICCD